MVVISVISHCKETAGQLETALAGRGHVIHQYSETSKDAPASLFIVDLDCEPSEAVSQVRAIVEHPSTALVPVLVAASAESEREMAKACAYSAAGMLRKPFRTVEAVPDTERALAGAVTIHW